MTLYIYRSQNSNHLNRPVKTRLLISVRFVPTIAETRIREHTNIVTGMFSNPGSQCAQADAEMGQRTTSPAEPDDLPDLPRVSASLSGMAMRLRLVGPDTSTKKEYHHAKSLLA